MADDATLAALFGSAGGSNRIPGDLDQFQRTVSANDIFKLVANQVGGYKVDSSTWSPATKIGTTAAQSFISAMLGSYAQDQEAKQLAAANQVLPQLYSNPNSVYAPDGVDKQAFEQLKANKIVDYQNRQSKSELDALNRQQDMQDRIKLSAIQNVFSADPNYARQALGLDSVSNGVPKAMQDDLLKEQGFLDARNKSLDYIKDQFERAKTISSAKALPNVLSMGVIPTYASDDLEAIGPSLIQQLDAAKGRETNVDQAKALLAKAPKWYDSPERIDQKAVEFAKLYDSFSKPTPLLDSYGRGGSPTPVPTPTPQIPGVSGGVFNGEKIKSITKIR